MPAIPDGSRAEGEKSEQAAVPARRRKAPKIRKCEKDRLRAEARARVVRAQGALCAAALAALLVCRFACPALFAAARQWTLPKLEENGAQTPLARFAEAVWAQIEEFPLPLPNALFLRAEAATNAPTGASLDSLRPAQSLVFPLGDAAWQCSSGYGWRLHPLTQTQRFHRGVDLACAEGTPVLAALGGTVAAARTGESYGRYLLVRSADGVETLYAHLQYLFVRAGEAVEAGQRLGTAGQTGDATGPHLHFELLQNGTRYDPSAALGLA
jgi:murein DD-endopeptidase MepM/ murein hydrolase activator NlpD